MRILIVGFSTQRSELLSILEGLVVASQDFLQVGFIDLHDFHFPYHIYKVETERRSFVIQKTLGRQKTHLRQVSTRGGLINRVTPRAPHGNLAVIRKTLRAIRQTSKMSTSRAGRRNGSRR
jgi:hypothetical protein